MRPNAKTTRPEARRSLSESEALVEFTKTVSLDVDLETARQLQVRGRGLRALPPSLGQLLRQVRKLDLAENRLSDLAPLAGMPLLSNLTISKNPEIRSLAGLSGCSLVVLTAAECSITSLEGLDTMGKTLKTLVLNNNYIQLFSPDALEASSTTATAAATAATLSLAVSNYKALSALSVCETVVLSRNETLCALYRENPDDTPADAGDKTKGGEGSDTEERALLARQHPLSVFEHLPALRKLSLSSCGLRSMPVRWFLPLLVELRLAHNSLTSMRPEGVIFRSLKILDVSHNDLPAVSTFRRLHFLQQIHLRGNPLVSTYVERDEQEMMPPESVTASPAQEVPLSLQRSLPKLLKHLQSIDGRPILSAEALAAERAKRHREPDPADERPAGKKHKKEQAEDEEDDALTKAISPGSSRGEGKTVPQKKRTRTREEIDAETDSKDAVVDLGLSEDAARSAQAKIVRRERVLTAPAAVAASRPVGGDAFELINQSREKFSSW